MSLDVFQDFVADLRGRINEITPDNFSDKVLKHWLQISYWYIIKKLAPILGDKLAVKLSFDSAFNKIILSLKPGSPVSDALYLDDNISGVVDPAEILSILGLIIEDPVVAGTYYPAKRVNISDYNALVNNSFFSPDNESPIYIMYNNLLDIKPEATTTRNIDLYYIPRTNLETNSDIILPQEYRDLVLYYAEILAKRRYNKPVQELEATLNNMIKEFYELYNFELKIQEVNK